MKHRWNTVSNNRLSTQAAVTERRCAKRPIPRRVGCTPIGAVKTPHVAGEMTAIEFWIAMGKADQREPLESGVLKWQAILAQGTVSE